MGHGQAAGPGCCGDAGRVRGGAVSVFDRQLPQVAGVGGLHHQQVDVLGQFLRGRAGPGVHDERERPFPSRTRHLLQPGDDTVDLHPALAVQLPDGGSGDAAGGQGLRVETDPGQVLHPVPDGGDAVVEAGRREDEILGPQHLTGIRTRVDGQEPNVGLVVVDAGAVESLDVLLPLGRVDHGDRVGHLLQGDALQHPGQPEAVVAVEVGEADDVDAARRDPGPGHLTLGALAAVKQDAAGSPSQQVAVVIPRLRGHQAGCSQRDELAIAHLLLLVQRPGPVADSAGRARTHRIARSGAPHPGMASATGPIPYGTGSGPPARLRRDRTLRRLLPDGVRFATMAPCPWDPGVISELPSTGITSTSHRSSPDTPSL